jgi:starch synthase (maltosyl-transferring)
VPRKKEERLKSEPADGRKRVVIEGVTPEIDSGRFAVKRVLGDRLRVEADIVADGHEVLRCVLLYRREGDRDWQEVPMEPLVNDRWWGEFTVSELGRSVYAIQAWIDHFRTWQQFLRKKTDVGQTVAVELLMGADLIESAQTRARGADARQLQAWAERLRQEGEEAPRVKGALSPELTALMQRYPDRRLATLYDKNLQVVVDPVTARFSTWYEMFPRSCSPIPGEHGTFKDCEACLPYIAAMGFDVL